MAKTADVGINFFEHLTDDIVELIFASIDSPDHKAKAVSPVCRRFASILRNPTHACLWDAVCLTVGHQECSLALQRKCAWATQRMKGISTLHIRDESGEGGMFGSSLLMMRCALPEALQSAGEAALELLPVLAAAACATGTRLTLSTADINPFLQKGWQQAQSEGTLRETLVHLDAAVSSLKLDGCLAAVTQLSALRHLCLIRGGSGPVLAGFLGTPAAFPKLRHLCLQNVLPGAGQLLPQGVLGGLSSLRRLQLGRLGNSRFPLPTLPPLTELTNLTRLELGALSVASVGGLRGFNALRELHMSPEIALTPQMVDDMATLPKLLLVDLQRDPEDFREHDRNADELERLSWIMEQTGGQLLVDDQNVDRRMLDDKWECWMHGRLQCVDEGGDRQQCSL